MTKALTLNQIMILLDIHRGTYRRENHVGTIQMDLMALETRGLIDWFVGRGGDTEYGTTSEGATLVERLKSAAA
jgi:hypothetical protein